MKNLHFIILIMIFLFTSCGERDPVDLPLGISISNATANEGDSLEFILSIDKIPTKEIEVDYQTKDGTATAGEDYVSSMGKITFRTGEGEKSIFVKTLTDPDNEDDETMTLNLSASSHPRFSAEASGTIKNIEITPTISGFDPVSGKTGETVIISGSDFSTVIDENEVRFNGITATISAASANEIAVSVPESAQTGKISVTRNGLTAESTEDFVVLIDTWNEVATFTGPIRNYGVSFSIEGKGYIGTGISPQLEYMSDLWAYDPESDDWIQKADFEGGGTRGAIGFSIGAKGYIGGGQREGTQEYSEEFYEYDPSTDTWTQKADYPGTSKYITTAFIIGDKGYVGGGYNDEFWEYDPALDKWTQIASFGGGLRSTPISFSINGKGYVGMGSDNTASAPIDIWEYDPGTDSWTQKADFAGAARRFPISFAIENRGYIATGYDIVGDDQLTDLWEYNPELDLWTQRATFPGRKRQSALSFSMGGKGYIGLGSGAGFTPDFWSYTP